MKHSFSTSAAIARKMRDKNNPAEPNTVRYFQRLCIQHREEILEKQGNFEVERKKILDTWAPAIAEQKIKDLRIDLEGEVAAAKAELEQDLNEMMECKRVRFKNVALSAPSEEQLRLLQTIALRADDLSVAEVSGLADNFMSSHQALRTLAHLAKKSGIHISVPDDAESFEATCSEAHNFLYGMIDYIDRPQSSFGYPHLDFFGYPDSSSGPTFCVCDQLDGKPYTVVQDEPSEKNTPETNPEPDSKATEEPRQITNNYYVIDLDGPDTRVFRDVPVSEG